MNTTSPCSSPAGATSGIESVPAAERAGRDTGKVVRLFRGCQSLVGVLLHPLGRFTGPLLRHLRTPERLERGLVVVLPGIEGECLINHSIARGLADGGFGGAIEI